MLHGTAKSVRILRLVGRPQGGDVSDWLADGHMAEELETLAATAPTWEPTGSGDSPQGETERRPNVVRLDSVEPEEVRWLWYPYIPYGRLTLIEGDPGLGKSYLTLAIAASTSRGRLPS